MGDKELEDRKLVRAWLEELASVFRKELPTFRMKHVNSGNGAQFVAGGYYLNPGRPFAGHYAFVLLAFWTSDGPNHSGDIFAITSHGEWNRLGHLSDPEIIKKVITYFRALKDRLQS